MCLKYQCQSSVKMSPVWFNKIVREAERQSPFVAKGDGLSACASTTHKPRWEGSLAQPLRLSQAPLPRQWARPGVAGEHEPEQGQQEQDERECIAPVQRRAASHQRTRRP